MEHLKSVGAQGPPVASEGSGAPGPSLEWLGRAQGEEWPRGPARRRPSTIRGGFGLCRLNPFMSAACGGFASSPSSHTTLFHLLNSSPALPSWDATHRRWPSLGGEGERSCIKFLGCCEKPVRSVISTFSHVSSVRCSPLRTDSRLLK